MMDMPISITSASTFEYISHFCIYFDWANKYAKLVVEYIRLVNLLENYNTLP